MRDTRALRSVLAGSVLAGATLLLPSAAHADEREACATAAEQAQSLRDEGKYRHAREQMLICARDACPAFIKSDCGKWLEQVDRDAPTVVLGAREAGRDVSDVKVSMDGVVLTERLDGKPQIVDVGEHTFRFERGGAVKEERVLLRAGEKGRAITVAFGDAAPPAAPSESPRDEASIVPALIVGGVGVVALGSFVVFGLQGTSAFDDLQACRPTCAVSDVDKARTKLIIADISLGVGVVALAVSAYMLITRPTAADPRGTSASAKSPRAVGFDLAPTLGGGAAALRGSF